jgi:hypothetical protein
MAGASSVSLQPAEPIFQALDLLPSAAIFFDKLQRNVGLLDVLRFALLDQAQILAYLGELPFQGGSSVKQRADGCGWHGLHSGLGHVAGRRCTELGHLPLDSGNFSRNPLAFGAGICATFLEDKLAL